MLIKIILMLILKPSEFWTLLKKMEILRVQGLNGRNKKWA